ncbi:MAG: TfoX/Sxy family protein [Rhodothermales bacterium]|nr:TfoX/Sxy family protein [Rhodothermales bacterium]
MATDDHVATLRNLGPRSAGWLEAVGNSTRADLEHVGSVAAFRLVREHGFAPSLNLLYALEAALRDVHWTSLDEDLRATLRREAE